MTNTTPQIFLDKNGDVEKEKALIPFAINQRGILSNLMSFNEIKQDQRKVNLIDGSTIYINSCFGIDKIFISCPLDVIVEEENSFRLEYLEIDNPDGWSYWNVFKEKLEDIKGNDGTIKQVWETKEEISDWLLNIYGGFTFEGRQIQTTTETGKIIYSVACVIRESDLERPSDLGVDNTWFLSVYGRSHLWLSVSDFTLGNRYYDPSIGWVYAAGVTVQDTLGDFEDFNGLLAPYVPLYSQYKNIAASADPYGNQTWTYDECRYPVIVETGNANGGYCICDYAAYMEGHYPVQEHSRSDGDQIFLTRDYFPYVSETSDEGYGSSFWYRYYDEHPCDSSGQTTIASGTQTTTTNIYKAVNEIGTYKNEELGTLEYSTVLTTTIEYERYEDWIFSFNPLDCGASNDGCNDANLTQASTNVFDTGIETRTFDRSEVTCPFGDLSTALHQEDETEVYYYGGGSYPPYDMQTSMYGRLEGLFSWKTLANLYTTMVKSGSSYVVGSSDIRVKWCKDGSMGVSPLGLPGTAALNSVITYSSSVKLVVSKEIIYE